jgi:large repetitive protein
VRRFGTFRYIVAFFGSMVVAVFVSLGTSVLPAYAATSPTITSANGTTFTEGTAGSFTVTSTGNATPALSEAGTLPSGVTFVDNGDGTATLSGTPASGSAGVYAITITASNGVPPDATQSFTLIVDAAPAFTSANSTAFMTCSAGSFTITTTSYPVASLSESGMLPPGVTFFDNGNGTATLSGTPSLGGSYPITITATNGVPPDAIQNFTLTVNGGSGCPTVTSLTSNTSGPGGGGTNVVVHGTGFGATASCASDSDTVDFGSSNPVTGTCNVSAGGTKISVTSPVESPSASGPTNPVDVTVTTNAGTSPTNPGDVFDYRAPTVTSVAPANGHAAGGNTVAIHGSQFGGVSPCSTTSVKFAGVSATCISVNGTGTVINVTVPTSVPLSTSTAVTMTATTPAGSATGSYTYDVPTVTSLTGGTSGGASGTGNSGPNTNSQVSNTAVIHGSDFGTPGTCATDGDTVDFGPGNPVTGGCTVAGGGANGTGNGTISVHVPASPGLATGPVTVSVATPDGVSNPDAGMYIYTAPTVTSVSGTGPAGTTVTLHGTNLNPSSDGPGSPACSGANPAGSTVVTFGGTPAATCQILNSTTIKVTSPAGSGTVAVQVATRDGLSNNTFTYTY